MQYTILGMYFFQLWICRQVAKFNPRTNLHPNVANSDLCIVIFSHELKMYYYENFSIDIFVPSPFSSISVAPLIVIHFLYCYLIIKI